jgi:zinc protease
MARQRRQEGEEVVMAIASRSNIFTRNLRAVAALALVAGALIVFAIPARAATAVERVVSPGGIEAWLVREPSIPLIAIDFAFVGGSCQVAPDKAGVASLTMDLLDEGAGELDSRAFHERVESYAIGLSFSASRDYVSGSLRTLAEHQDVAFDLLRLALTQPRFDSDVVERVRTQVISGLRRATMNPNDLANRVWWAKAFAGHPYAEPVAGTLQTVPSITVADLKDFVRRTFARDTLKIGIVGNVDAAQAGKIVDRIFGGLPARAELKDVPAAKPLALGDKLTVELDVPQSVVMVGGAGLAQKDPDFMPAFVLNHILGGGSFTSRLYREVREVRGLAYSVYSAMLPLDHAALFVAGTATRTDRADEALEVIHAEIRRLAETGPTEEELAAAKSYLKGSYPLRFDTSGKIANQLVMLQLSDLGIDYFVRRNGLVDKVTLDDVRRVAKRLLSADMLATVVGRGQAIAGSGSTPAARAVPAAVPPRRDGG